MALTVLQLVPSLRSGGVETGTVDLARTLVAQGHRAIVISSGGPLVSVLEAAGVIHYTLPIHRKVPWSAFPLAARVAEVVESHGVDIIHARSRVPAIIGYLAWRQVIKKMSFRLNKRTQIPSFVTTAHGYYSDHPFSRIMGWGRFVIANSERIYRHMVDDFHVPAERVRLIHRGVDLSQFPWRDLRLEAPRGDWVVGCIGRITPIKGHRDLIRAFGIASKDFPRARLLLVGEAASRYQGYLRELKTLVTRLGLEGKVEFAGHQQDVPGVLRQMDLLVLSSTGEEAFGRVLVEAGAAGVPVVATRVGGVSEVVLDKRTGLLVPPRDPMNLSQAITTLLKDRELAATLARENRQWIQTQYPLSRMVHETLKVYREVAEPVRILVMKLSAIGDVVLATPSLRAIRHRFPKAHVTVLVGRESRELLHRCPYLNDLAVFDRSRHGTPMGLMKLAKRLNQGQVDLVIDFQNNRISHWLGRLSLAPLRYGYASRRWSWLLTHRVQQPAEALAPVRQQFRLLQLLGIETDDDRLELWPGASDEARAETLLQEGWTAERQPLVAIHPGAGWDSKQWPLECYAELCGLLASKMKARVVLTGSTEERGLCEEIYRQAHTKPIIASGLTSLNELAALLRRAQLFLGGDTAALHVASAAGVPIIALFGSTDPARHLPPAQSLKLFNRALPCSPCYHRRCYRTGEGHMECMRAISVEEVAEAATALLKVPV